MSFDSLPLEFGLDNAARVDSLVINWSSGLLQILTGLEADQILTILESPSKVREDRPASLPGEFSLSQNFPNPFNGLTNIEYHVPKVADVAVAIYDILGQRIKTLAAYKHQPGIHFLTWDSSDDSGNQLTSGIYFIRMSAANFEQIRKIIYLK